MFWIYCFGRIALWLATWMKDFFFVQNQFLKWIQWIGNKNKHTRNSASFCSNIKLILLPKGKCAVEKTKQIKGLKYRMHWKKRTVYGWLKKSIAFMANTAPLSSQGVIWFWGPIRLMSSPFVFNIGSLWGSSWHIKFPLLYQMRYRLHVEV